MTIKGEVGIEVANYLKTFPAFHKIWVVTKIEKRSEVLKGLGQIVIDCRERGERDVGVRIWKYLCAFRAMAKLWANTIDNKKNKIISRLDELAAVRTQKDPTSLEAGSSVENQREQPGIIEPHPDSNPKG